MSKISGSNSSYLKKIPNWLTYLRLGLIPLLVILLIDPSPWMGKAAAIVFVLAAVTDFFDGFIARRFGAVSDFGKLMDPLVDKLLVVSALIMLCSLRSDVTGAAWVPGWMVVLVVAREVWVTGLRGVAASRGVIVPAGLSGKLKSLLQMIAIVLLLLHDARFSIHGVAFVSQVLGLNLLVLSLVFSYFGAYEYTMSILGSADPESSGPESQGTESPAAEVEGRKDTSGMTSKMESAAGSAAPQ